MTLTLEWDPTVLVRQFLTVKVSASNVNSVKDTPLAVDAPPSNVKAAPEGSEFSETGSAGSDSSANVAVSMTRLVVRV